MLRTLITAFALAVASGCAALGPDERPAYRQVNLAATQARFGAPIVDPALANAWGIAIRPAGFGGHFWVTGQGSGESVEYVGDVGGEPLFQDELKLVAVPGAAQAQGTPTGVVFNGGQGFVITQAHSSGAITAPAKFVFATDTGTLSAWTERKRADGGFDWPRRADLKVDLSSTGAQFFGLGISASGRRLYAADFGTAPQVRIFDSNFREAPARAAFASPFARGTPKPGDYAPFNVQQVGPGGRLFVTYAKTQPSPEDRTRFYAGEEQSGRGLGRLAEFDENGRLVAVWRDKGLLNAPWGLAYAPPSFGAYGGMLLVGNFGDGTIVAFDPRTRVAVDYVRDAIGKPIAIDGLWGLQFGNGASLGSADALYFAAGPEEEKEGLFGKLIVEGEQSSGREPQVERAESMGRPR